jgi:translation initiation factor 1
VADDRPFHNPFGVLGALRDSLPERATPAVAKTTPEARPEKSKTGGTIPRAVVRLERAGRGGKDVTVVEHLAIPPGERAAWLKALKAQLGCGGVVEEDALVLQGDHRKRLPALLTARGVRKVTVG